MCQYSVLEYVMKTAANISVRCLSKNKSQVKSSQVFVVSWQAAGRSRGCDVPMTRPAMCYKTDTTNRTEQGANLKKAF